MPEVVELTASHNPLSTTTTEGPKKKTVLMFYADWHEATPVMENVLHALATSASTDDNIVFLKVAAESMPALCKQYQVTSVPTFVLLHADGTVADKIQGGTQDNNIIPTLTLAVQKLAAEVITTTTTATTTSSTTPGEAAEEEQLKHRLETLIRSAPVMLFMKGTPTAPRCGFSRQAVEMLQDEQIPFGSFDILTDNTVRQGLKTYSDWPTYPQLYVHGELMGGLDIMKEMKEDSSLQNGLGLSDDDLSKFAVSTSKPAQSLNDRLKELITSNRIMLFMKGLPSAPKCGFSRQMVDILNELHVPYGTFDILTDDDVRQGLKTYSDWPTYPQLYVNGELIGGLDIVKEMKDDGMLQETLQG
jgi:Grx4 family monothiol glutaredoxin